MPKTNPRISTGGNRATWDPKNVFQGTAWFYARYRPAYPEKVTRILRERFALNQDSRVIDLGCGTGQVAIKLAPYVAEIIAIDPQEDMLQEGKTLASAKSIDNIDWLLGESTNLLSLVKRGGEVDLTVIAQAFHWMDQESTLQDLYRLTRPGGGIALINDHSPPDSLEIAWKEAIKETVKKWLGEERRAGTTGIYTHPTKPYQDVINESAFKDQKTIGFKTERTWSIDRIIGYIYSTSYASIPVLGNKKERFEADLRDNLVGISPEGKFKEKTTIQVIMAWKR